jgi:hypothetical protein
VSVIKLKISAVGAAFLLLITCASVHQENENPVFEKSKTYEKFTFDEIWNAVRQSLDDIGFVLKSEIKQNGFLYAQARKNPDPRYLPPHMNIIVREENGGIRVNCHMVVPSRSHAFDTERSYINRFFKALNDSLKRQLKNYLQP